MNLKLEFPVSTLTGKLLKVELVLSNVLDNKQAILRKISIFFQNVWEVFFFLFQKYCCTSITGLYDWGKSRFIKG